MTSLRRSNRSSQQEESHQTQPNGTSSKRKARLSSPRSNEDSEDQLTPKRARRASKSKANNESDHSQDKGSHSDSDSDSDDFTPKSTARSAARGSGRGRARGRGRAKPTGDRVKSTPKIPKVKKARISKATKQQLETDGNETNHDNPEGAMIPQAEYEIDQDNDLFNTIRMGASAIQPTLEDWMDIYQGSTTGGDDELQEDAKGQAISQFINFILRSCGCNCSIDKHKALDIDAITDTLDTIQETFKKVRSQAYPLIVKSGKSVSKNFRKNLISLCQQLVQLAHSNEILYDEHFIPIIQSYLVSMSSSTLRSFRHTSTVISLFGFINPMCELLINTKKELISLTRKVEIEAAKKHANKSKLDQLHEWQKRKKHVLKEKTSLENIIDEFFDGVFVHRYRDADPSIRVDCVQALGQWMSMVPDYFLEGNYLRYIGWVLTDSNKDARNEALRALCTLYSKEENIGVMQHFTSRFRSRLIEMATGESDFTTRCLSINIVTQIDRHGLLDSSQRNQLGRLIYHEDSRVRKAASAFFGNMFQETLEARKLRLDALTNQSSNKGNGPHNSKQKSRTTESETQIAFKCLAHLLLKLERVPKSDSIEDGQSSNSEDEIPTDEDNPENTGQRHLGSFYQNDIEKGRIDLAIEDLWPRVEVLHDWEALCHYLLLDHTASTNRPQKSTVPAHAGRSSISLGDVESSASDDHSNNDSVKDMSIMNEACKLNEAEETILVEVLVASLRKFGSTLSTTEALKLKKRKKRVQDHEVTDEEGVVTTEDEATVARRAQKSTGAEDEEPENKTDLTRVMINLLPKLWSKFMSDPVKLTEVFRIPKLMSLNMYLDLRMVSAFEDMWDTMIKQYLKQQDIGLIQVISSTISHVLNDSKSLEHINEPKILKLHEALTSSLIDLTTNDSSIDLEKDELDEDQLASITLLLTKIARLFRQSDLSKSIKNKDLDLSGKVTPYDLIYSLSKRAHLAYLSEVKLVEVSLEILQLNFTWTSVSIYRATLSNQTSIDPPITAPIEAGGDAGSSSLSNSLLEHGILVRDNLVKTLTDYVVSSNDNIHESIKRAAFIHLLNTYLLCQGALIPKDLRLECDEEIQSKFAQFIELEIQKFVKDPHEQLDENGEQVDHMPGPSTHTKKSKKDLASKSKSKSIPDQSITSYEELQRIEEFDLLITTYSKSIRCGLIDIKHTIIMIQHYTRFNKIFDISIELIIATLIDNISDIAEQNSLVINCLIDIFKASFELYLDVNEDYTEEQFIKLTRLLQSVIIHRGARMSYKSRFDSSLLMTLHLDCIRWIIGKAGVVPELEPPELNQLGTMFRGLTLLLIGIDGRSCLKIKAELEKLIEDRQFDIPATKSWDPYQLYKKRLISMMAKDPNIARAAKLALQKQSGGEGEEGETSNRPVAVNGERNNDEDGGEADQTGMGPPASKANKTRRKPRPKKLKSKAREINPESGDEGVTEAKSKKSAGKGVSRQRSRSPEVSSRVPTSSAGPSHRRREASVQSVVSVVIPAGPKRKRLISEQHRSQQPSQSGGEPSSSQIPTHNHKRARLSAVVIGKSKANNVDSDPTKSRKKDRVDSSQSVDRSLPSGSPDSSSRPKPIPSSSASSSRRSPTADIHPDPPRDLSSSPAQSEISLAAIKRNSRQQNQK
ncbi:hypothetical protein Pst134EB_014389 [Puccinia striiformis f. sp. tritici]|nr:hypothetical protein Pst134EB_014389 [Puccinia striiformis f. sp. tritici]